MGGKSLSVCLSLSTHVVSALALQSLCSSVVLELLSARETSLISPGLIPLSRTEIILSFIYLLNYF